MSDIANLRIRFYGVQGSGSIFPSYSERLAARELSDQWLLERVFEDLRKREGADGRLNVSVEELLGGPIDRKTLQTYRNQFQIQEPRVYGGWTTCVHVETADGHDIVIDCGSGFRLCANDLVKKWADREDRELYILGSHSHFDHTEGFDQAAVCFDARNRLHVMSNRQYIRALDQLLGIFSHKASAYLKGVQTPLHYELMPAQFDSHEIRDLNLDPPQAAGEDFVNHYHHIEDPIVIGGTRIEPFEVFHPSPCLAYRIERNGKVFVFCTDHELRRGEDPNDPLQIASLEAEERLRQMSMGADLLYRDGQFLQAEYDGHQGIGTPFGVSRLDWGHSCIEDVITMSEFCGIGRTLIGHHDPNREWSERNWIDEMLKRRSEQAGRGFELAQAETVVDL